MSPGVFILEELCTRGLTLESLIDHCSVNTRWFCRVLDGTEPVNNELASKLAETLGQQVIVDNRKHLA